MPHSERLRAHIQQARDRGEFLARVAMPPWEWVNIYAEGRAAAAETQQFLGQPARSEVPSDPGGTLYFDGLGVVVGVWINDDGSIDEERHHGIPLRPADDIPYPRTDPPAW